MVLCEGLWQVYANAMYELKCVELGGVTPCAGGPTSNVVDIFNVRSGAWTTAVLSAARFSLAATSLPNDGVAMFAGGAGASCS